MNDSVKLCIYLCGKDLHFYEKPPEFLLKLFYSQFRMTLKIMTASSCTALFCQWRLFHVVTRLVTCNVLPPQSGITLFVSVLTCNPANASSVSRPIKVLTAITYSISIVFPVYKIVPFLISWIMDVCLIKCETEKSSQSILDWPPVSGGVSHLTSHTLPLPDCLTLPHIAIE